MNVPMLMNETGWQELWKQVKHVEDDAFGCLADAFVYFDCLTWIDLLFTQRTVNKTSNATEKQN